MLRRCLPWRLALQINQIIEKKSSLLQIRPTPTILSTCKSFSERWDDVVPTTSRDSLSKNLIGNKDIMAEKLKGAKSFLELFKLHHKHQHVMNNYHISLIFEKIFNKTKIEDINHEALIKSEPFHLLCNQTLRMIRFFEKEELLQILKTLYLLGVHQDTKLFHAIWQMLRHMINDLNIGQVIFIERLLRKSHSNKHLPVVEAIQIALPFVLQNLIETQLNPDNLEELIQCLGTCIRLKLKAESQERTAALIFQKSDAWTKDQALNIFFAVGRNSTWTEHCKKLRELSLISMEEAIEGLPEKQCHIILAIIRKTPDLYSQKLFTRFSHKAVTEKWSLFSLMQLLVAYDAHEFVSTEVLDLVAQTIENNPDVLINDQGISILTLVEAFSVADYLPSSSRNFLKVFLRCHEKLDKLEKEAPHLFVKLVTHLAILEAATPELLCKVMNENFVRGACERTGTLGGKLLLQNYRLLEQAARLEFPGYQGPFLSKELLSSSIKDRAEAITPLDVRLKDFLELGLGGPQFMLSGLWTRLGHFVDHIIVMRKGDFPISQEPNRSALEIESRNDGLKYIEDINVPNDAKILAVLVARQEWFTRNPARLSGWAAFHHRTLSKLGYSPIVLGPPVGTEGRSQDLCAQLDNEIY